MNKAWFSERIYAAYKIVALVETMKELGYAVEQCLDGTELTAKEIYETETRSSVGQYFTACRNAIDISGNPEVAFLVGRRLHLSAYGMYGYALLCSPTIRDAMDTAARYHKLATPTMSQQWREESGAAIWTFDRLPIPHVDEDLHRFLLEQQLAQHVTQIHDLIGSNAQLLRFSIPYPAPEHADLYHHHLRCPVHFGQSKCELHVDAAMLGTAPILANRLTSNLLQATCERLIGKSKFSTGTTGRVYQILTSTPGKFPAMEETAKYLNMTSRTLRRRLTTEGTSFSDIFDDVRQSFAMEYLRTTKMSTESIGGLIGFSDAANFRHAFKKWTGQSPGEYRKIWADSV